MRAFLCLCLAVISCAFADADDKPPQPSRAAPWSASARQLTADIAGFAHGGDADFARLLEDHKLKDIDWATLAQKDEPKMEQTIQSIVLDLLRLQEHNEHAKKLVEKYNIKQQKG